MIAYKKGRKNGKIATAWGVGGFGESYILVIVLNVEAHKYCTLVAINKYLRNYEDIYGTYR